MSQDDAYRPILIRRWAVLLLTLLISACGQAAPIPSTQAASAIPSSMATPTLTGLQWFHELYGNPTISLDDNGKAFTFEISQRYYIYLDDDLYPRDELNCIPNGIIGSVINGEWGPDIYPVRYEAVQPGTCVLVDRDFQVTITVVIPTPYP